MSSIYDRQEFVDYYTDRFGPDWQDDILTPSGISGMITDLVLLSEGLAMGFDKGDIYATASGIAATNTNKLYELVTMWNTDENTVYSNYLYANMIEIIAKSEPTIKLKRWFGLEQNDADIMWNLLNYYKKEEQNLDSAYLKSFNNVEEDLKIFDYDNSLL